MNKFVKDTFADIVREEASYRRSVETALLTYRRNMVKVEEDAGAYKDEAAYIESKKAAAIGAAKTEIRSAEYGFTTGIKMALNSLRDDLQKHLTTRPAAAFLDALRIYYDFDIRPSYAEITALMEQNGGNPLGYRAINRTLEKTGAEYRIDAPDAAAYEADLAALEKLTHGNFMCVPDGCLHEAVEVFGGDKRLFMRDDGSTYDAGHKWDSTSILAASFGYKESTGAFDDMADRWSSTILPKLKHISAYEDQAQQMAEDIAATAHAPEITRSEQPAVEMARQMGAKKAEAMSASIPDKYRI